MTRGEKTEKKMFLHTDAVYPNGRNEGDPSHTVTEVSYCPVYRMVKKTVQT
jgi:hypothetical protein